jgi:hypothetical protein
MKRSTDSEKAQRRLLLDLANGTVEHFEEIWPQYEKVRGLARLRRELQTIWRRYKTVSLDELPDEPLTINPDADAFKETKECLRRAGEMQADEHFEECVIEGWLRRAKSAWQVEWHPKPRLKANKYSLPAMLSLALIKNGENLGYCARKACEHPYFIKDRRDQRYCSARCAGIAKREAKFRWHREHRWKGMWSLSRKG